MQRPSAVGAWFAATLTLAVGCTSGGAATAAGPGVAAPAAATAAAPTATTPTAGPSATITIAAVGDILMGTAPDKLPPAEGRGFFDRVAAPLAADLTMGNLETPLSEPTGHVKCRTGAGCHAFRMPPSYASVLRDGGFHVLSLANNHTHDAGPAGLANTRTALTAAGITPTGGPGEIARYAANGITVAVLGFGPYAWMQSVTDIDATAALVRRAQTRADLVVVTMHVGGEGAARQHVRPGTESFLGEDRGDPIAFAHAVVDAGADLVIGHSPHVLRAMEFYRGRLIAYSTGNFAGYRVLSTVYPLDVGAVVRATLAPDGGWVGGTLVGTALVDGGLPAVDPQRRALALVRDLSAADLPRSAVKVGPDGTLSP